MSADELGRRPSSSTATSPTWMALEPGRSPSTRSPTSFTSRRCSCPLAQADPPRGALVNVVGTVNVFEAVKRGDVQGSPTRSSAAAYDRADGIRVAEDADGHPLNHYGVHKLANEGAARVYWHDAGLASVGLRPHIVYGPGRDHGMTAGPTLAMAAAVRRRALRDPVRRARPVPVRARRRRAVHRGAPRSAGGRRAPVRNLGGPSEHVTDVIAAIEAAVPEAAGTITLQRGRGAPAARGHGGRRPRHHAAGRRACARPSRC